MCRIDISKRSIGVNFNAGTAEIWLWAPDAKSVSIDIKTKKKLALTKEEFGYWHLSTYALAPGDEYKFLLNGDKLLPDPASLLQPEGVHEASQAFDLKAFQWTDHKWKNPTLDHYIFYELHTGTFTAEGNFSAIHEKINHLKELGINAVELMPVACFPGNRNWGYDGVFPFAVHNCYGGPEELQKLVNAFHEKEIAVVLDVVYNHLGPEGNYHGEFAPYFTDKYKTPWGLAVNFDDAHCDGVRHFFIENALMWFRDFHVDALRLDAVHAIKDFSAVHFLRELKQRVSELAETTGKTHHLIVECDLNDTRFINPLEEQGYGMDAQWCDEFHHALRVASGQEQTGYYSDFNGISHLAKAYKDAYVYDGQYSKHRKKKFGIKAEHHPGEQFIVFSQNHDQVGNRMLGERTSRLVSFEMQKLMAGAVMVSPCLPLLFMGEEWGEPNPFQYFVSHTDAELAEAVRKGRKEEFREFHLKGEAPDPMAEDTFLNSKLQWELVDKEPHAALFRYYKELIRIRKNYLPLRLFNRKQLSVQCNEKYQTLVLTRWCTHSHKICCFMNFSDEPKQIMVPESENTWCKLLASADPVWNGQTESPEELMSAQNLQLPPQSILIYSDHV